MKYYFSLLGLFFFGVYHTSAIESVRFYQAPSLPYLYIEYINKNNPYIDFGPDISSLKVHHVGEIFPKNSEENHSPAKIPEYTPELYTMKDRLPIGFKKIILQNIYPWNSNKKFQKIKLYPQIPDHEDKNDYPQQTNTNNILYYSIESPHDTTQKITIYPIDPRYYWFLDYDTREYIYALAGGKILNQNIQKNGDIPIPPLVMLGSDMDMYDISVETGVDSFTKIFSPKSRKLQLTQFGPTYQLSSYGELGQTLYTLLPYYEVDIPLKKGYNTVRITYQSFTRMPESIKETLRIDK